MTTKIFLCFCLYANCLIRSPWSLRHYNLANYSIESHGSCITDFSWLLCGFVHAIVSVAFVLLPRGKLITNWRPSDNFEMIKCRPSNIYHFIMLPPCYAVTATATTVHWLLPPIMLPPSHRYSLMLCLLNVHSLQSYTQQLSRLFTWWAYRCWPWLLQWHCHYI